MQNKIQRIYFKAEVNDILGAGHIQRSLSLAEECVFKKKDINFIFADSSTEMILKVKSLGYNVILLKKDIQYDVREYLKFIQRNSLLIFDTDDYNYYSGKLIDDLKKNEIKTACFTITDKYLITTDYLVNTNIIAFTHNYNTPEETKKILGPEYLIFNKEFRKNKYFKKEKNRQNELLLFFGNADSNHITLNILQILDKLKSHFSKINILTGNLNKDFIEIKNIVENYNSSMVNLITDITPKEMFNLYKNTDFMITSGGMTMWEAALFEIPQMVIASSKREILYTEYLYKLNYIYKLCDFETVKETETVKKNIINFIEKELYRNLHLSEFKNIINPLGINSLCKALTY